MTLPLIVALQRCDPSEADLIRQAIEQPDAEHFQTKLNSIMTVIHRTGALEATHALAKLESQRAIAALASMADSAYKQALIHLAQISVARTA